MNGAVFPRRPASFFPLISLWFFWFLKTKNQLPEVDHHAINWHRVWNAVSIKCRLNCNNTVNIEIPNKKWIHFERFPRTERRLVSLKSTLALCLSRQWKEWKVLYHRSQFVYLEMCNSPRGNCALNKRRNDPRGPLLAAYHYINTHTHYRYRVCCWPHAVTKKWIDLVLLWHERSNAVKRLKFPKASHFQREN